METKCEKPTYTANGVRRGNCAMKGVKLCVNCGDESCWLHGKRPCSEGRMTRYGRLQHVTDEEKRKLEGAVKLSLEKLGLTRDNEETIPSHTVTITVRVQDGRGKEMLVNVHPGRINIPAGQRGWRPDEELTGWLKKRLGQNAPKAPIWSKERECLPVITRAARRRTAAKEREKPREAANS